MNQQMNGTLLYEFKKLTNLFFIVYERMQNTADQTQFFGFK